MTDTDTPTINPFAAGYTLVQNADVHTYSEEEAIMDVEMFEYLRARYGQPLIGYVGGLHYQFRPERQIPTNAVAVPDDSQDDPDALLIQR